MAAKKLQRIKPKKNVSSLEVKEQVPDWLKQLLAKYGERPGPILGLEGDETTFEEISPPAEPMPLPEEDASELSALLEKMAEEGSTDRPGDQIATSVEWGAYADAAGEASSPEIDDLLTDLPPPQDEYHDQPTAAKARPAASEPLEQPDSSMDWLSAPPTTDAELSLEPDYDQSTQPDPTLQFDEAPDWLDEPPPSVKAREAADWPAEPPASAAPTPATTEETETDMPDWLIEALNQPASTDAAEVDSIPAAPASTPPEVAGDDVVDMPDWLSDALVEPTSSATSIPAAPTAPPSATPAAESDIEIPDWLLETLDTTSPEPPTAPPTEAVQPPPLSQTDQEEFEASSEPQIETLPESSEATDTPDWLSNVPPHLDQTMAEVDETEPEADEPDWLSGITSAVADEPLPDWLSSETTDEEISEETPTTRDVPDIPDWIADGELATDAVSSLEEESSPQAGTDQLDVSDWLTSTEESPAALADEPVLTKAEVSPTAPAEKEVPDWPISTEETEKALGESVVQEPLPDWVADLVPADTSGGEAAETAPPPPDWANELASPTTPSSSKPDATPAPDWVAALVPPGFETETEEVPKTRPPTKLKKLAAKPAVKKAKESEPAVSPLEAEDTVDIPKGELETPDWLSEVSDTAATAESFTRQLDEAEPETFDWLSELRQSTSTDESAGPAEPVAGEELELPDWLSESPEAMDFEEESTQSVIEEKIETPDWLSEYSEVPDTGELTAPTEPVAEEAPSPAEPDREDELQFPSWLSKAEPEQATAEEEDETPDWLTELPEAPDTGELVAPSEPIVEEAPSPTVLAAEDELEIPSWLSEAEPGLAVAEEASAPPAVEKEDEAPDWLGELPDGAETGELTTPAEPVAEEEDEIPDWLAELPTAPDTGELTAPAEPVIEEEDESPEWLSELPEAPDTGKLTAPAEPVAEEAPSLAQPAVEDELELPPWLSEVEPELTAAEEEDEMPGWLAELPEAPDTGELTAPTEPASEGVPLPKEPATEDEIVFPSWLAETEEAPAEEEGETPGWLAELTAPAEPVVEEEDEAPEWLAELPTAPDTGELTAPTEPIAEEAPSPAEPDREDELQFPSWLSKAEPEQATAEEEDETPDWLTELPEAPDTGELVAPSEPIVEEAPSPTVLAAEDELEIPSWLSEAEPGLAVAEEEDETPDWLSELPTVPDTGELTTTTEAITGEEPETPPQTFEQPEVPDTDELLTLEESSTTEPEGDLPDWLSGSTESATAEAVSDQTDTGQESELDQRSGMPKVRQDTSALLEFPFDDWSTERAEPISADEALTSPLVDEEAVEPPAWLMELSEPTTTEEEDQALDQTTSTTPEQATDEPAIAEELEIPDWLSELPEATTADKETTPQPASKDDLEMPEWLSELPGPTTTEETTSPPPPIKDDLEMPEWLSELPEPAATEELPTQPGLEEEMVDSDLPTASNESSVAGEAHAQSDMEAVKSSQLSAEEESAIPEWLSGILEPTAAQAPTVEAKAASSTHVAEPTEQTEEAAADLSTESEEPGKPVDWLAGLGEATEAVKAALPPKEAETIDTLFLEGEPDIPDWLLDSPEAPAKDEEEDTATSVSSDVDTADIAVDVPDWLKEAPAAEEEETPTSEPDSEDEKPKPPAAETPDDPKASARSSKPSGPSSWLEAVKPTGAGVEEDDSNVAESTGMLAGIPGLLPAEKMTGTKPATELGPDPTEGRQDALRRAAQEFHEVATQVPKPATLPSTLTGGTGLTGGILRSGLYLLFIALIALPLIMQGEAPWTELAGGSGGTLDQQRRELISNELGIVDSQQPGSVALVSFDYTTATQGEMEPLAEALVGRLRGQGMRLIFLSLEPEGVALAQATLERILEEREESYGIDMVNLGYLPGQAAAIRELVSGQKPLSTLNDYKDGLSFADPERSGWSGLSNLEQIDMVITITDNPTTARMWIEQMELITRPNDDGTPPLLAATSATANPFLRPYRDSNQLDGLISGINGAAAMEAGRKSFGLARQMLDSQSLAHLSIVILIAAGTIAGWMPASTNAARFQKEATIQDETADVDKSA